MSRIESLQQSELDDMFSIIQSHYAAVCSYPIGGAWTRRDLEMELEKGYGIGLFEGPCRLKSFILYRKVDWGCDIFLLASRKEFVGQGCMKSLLKEMIGRLPIGKSISLEVHEFNAPARKLYEKLGFEKVQERRRYYRDGGNAIVYFFSKMAPSVSPITVTRAD